MGGQVVVTVTADRSVAEADNYRQVGPCDETVCGLAEQFHGVRSDPCHVVGAQPPLAVIGGDDGPGDAHPFDGDTQRHLPGLQLRQQRRARRSLLHCPVRQ